MSHSVARTIIDSNSTVIVKACDTLTVIGNNNIIKVTGPDATLAVIGSNNVISGTLRLTSLAITGDNNRNDVVAKNVTCFGSNNRTVDAVVSAYVDSDNDVDPHPYSSDDNYDELVSDFSSDDDSSCESDPDYEEAVRRSLVDQQKSLDYAHYEPFSVLNSAATGVARPSVPISQRLDQSVANLRAIVANSRAGTARVRDVDAERRDRDVVPLGVELDRQRREAERLAREAERVSTDNAVWMMDAQRRVREAEIRRIEAERRGREAAIRVIEGERRRTEAERIRREAESRRTEAERIRRDAAIRVIETELHARDAVDRRGDGRTIDLRTTYDSDHDVRPVHVYRSISDPRHSASPLTVIRRLDAEVANDAAPSAPPQQLPTKTKFAKPANITVEQDVAVDERTPESETCNICLANQRKLAFIPCGHRLSCIACTYTIIDKHLASPERDQAHVPCPVCREPCTMVAPVFNC